MQAHPQTCAVRSTDRNGFGERSGRNWKVLFRTLIGAVVLGICFAESAVVQAKIRYYGGPIPGLQGDRYYPPGGPATINWSAGYYPGAPGPYDRHGTVPREGLLDGTAPIFVPIGSIPAFYPRSNSLLPYEFGYYSRPALR